MYAPLPDAFVGRSERSSLSASHQLHVMRPDRGSWRQHLSVHTSSSKIMCCLIEHHCSPCNYITCEKKRCKVLTAPSVRMCSQSHVYEHVIYVLTVIDRNCNDKHQCVIDGLSLFVLIMLSPYGAMGLLCAVLLFDCPGAYLSLIFILNRIVFLCNTKYRCVYVDVFRWVVGRSVVVDTVG